MNNKGWGLREELMICLVLLLFFGIALVSIHKVKQYLDTSSDLSIDNNTYVETKPSNNNNKSKESEVKIEKSVNVNYANIEDKLVSAGKAYVNKYYNDIKLNDRVVVTVVRLQTEDLLEDLKVNNKLCSGYLELEISDNDTKYFPYIKCGSIYETRGYVSEKDNTDL